MLLLTIQVLLSLIINSKKHGKGLNGNGKILVKLFTVCADCPVIKNEQGKIIENKESAVLSQLANNNKLNQNNKKFQAADKTVCTMIHGRKENENKKKKENKNLKFTFINFEQTANDFEKYRIIMSKMRKICDEIFDEQKIEGFVNCLLEIIRCDDNISDIFYGGKFVPKKKFFGKPAHPKKICLEAFLAGLFYYVNVFADNENTGEKLSDKTKDLLDRFSDNNNNFYVVRYEKNKYPFDIDMPIDLETSLKRKLVLSYIPDDFPEKLYDAEIFSDGKTVSKLPDKGNLFLFGHGGVGKSTVMFKEILENAGGNRTYFYIPLCKYREDIHKQFSMKSCFFLINILLEYHYGNEYYTYETCSACEGEENILKNLHDLERRFFESNVKTEYVLMLDAVNDIPLYFQKCFEKELEYMVSEWKNVQIIVSGKTIPDSRVFESFKKLEVCGINDEQVESILSEIPKPIYNIKIKRNLKRLLNNPLFLKYYVEKFNSRDSIYTCGELLDCYIMHWNTKISDEDMKMTLEFTVQYVLPFVAKRSFLCPPRSGMHLTGMVNRTDFSLQIENAFESLLENQYVYRNYIVPKGFNKDILYNIKDNYDIIELILKNTCLMKIMDGYPGYFKFAMNEFAYYFAGKFITNLLEALLCSFKGHLDEAEKFALKHGLTSEWFVDREYCYIMVGEICGDYKNKEYRQDNVITDFLWFCKNEDFGEFRAVENIIRTMKYSRDGIIYNVDFSNTNLGSELPADVKFIDCDFTECSIMLIKLCDLYINSEYTYKTFLKKAKKTLKGCDFRECDFLFSEYKDILKKIGAITD